MEITEKSNPPAYSTVLNVPAGGVQNTQSAQPVQYGQPQPAQTQVVQPAQTQVVQYGQPQPVQYGQPQAVQYGQPGQTIVMAAPPQQTVIVQGVVRPPSYLWLSCIVFWCCNCIMGAIAFGLSIASENAASENRIDEARNYGRGSLYTSIAGVVFGVVLYIVVIILYIVVWNKIADNINNINENNNNYWDYNQYNNDNN